MKLQYLADRLSALQKEALYREVSSFEPVSATHVKQRGRKFLMMASNDYLGLTHHPSVRKAAINAAEKYGTGSGGSRLTSGSHILFSQLEQDLAEFKQTESSLVFSTGYMANVGTISAIADKDDYIISDELNHASIIDGCRLSRARCFVYPHKNTAEVEKILKTLHTNRTVLIVTDSVFSMDGDIAPLEELAYLADKYNALLMVDDAHATGILGNGYGSAEHFQLHGKIDIQLGTLSKALASVGGFVAGKKILTDYLVNKARSFIFSTALTPADIAAAKEALHLISADNSYVKKLWQNTLYMKQQLAKYRIETDSATPIIPIIVHENDTALSAAQNLYEQGIIISAIRPPTVAPNESRLRLTVTAAHTVNDLDFAAQQIKSALK